MTAPAATEAEASVYDAATAVAVAPPLITSSDARTVLADLKDDPRPYLPPILEHAGNVHLYWQTRAHATDPIDDPTAAVEADRASRRLTALTEARTALAYGDIRALAAAYLVDRLNATHSDLIIRRGNAIITILAPHTAAQRAYEDAGGADWERAYQVVKMLASGYTNLGTKRDPNIYRFPQDWASAPALVAALAETKNPAWQDTLPILIDMYTHASRLPRTQPANLHEMAGRVTPGQVTAAYQYMLNKVTPWREERIHATAGHPQPADVYKRLLGCSKSLIVDTRSLSPAVDQFEPVPNATQAAVDAHREIQAVKTVLADSAIPYRDRMLRAMLAGDRYSNADVARLTGMFTSRVAQIRTGNPRKPAGRHR